MKPRNKHLNDVLLSCKPGRHADKRKRHQVTEEEKQIKEYRHKKRRYREEEYEDMDL